MKTVQLDHDEIETLQAGGKVVTMKASVPDFLIAGGSGASVEVKTDSDGVVLERYEVNTLAFGGKIIAKTLSGEEVELRPA